MYAPKSKYKVDISGGNEFMYVHSLEEFQGTYIILSSGKMYAGSKLPSGNTQHLEIIPKIKKTKPETYIVKNNTGYNKRYGILKPKILKNHDNFHPIISTKPCPTVKDYEKGFFYRYFVRRKNALTQYYEVDKETFKEISKGGKKYDSELYGASKIRWDLLDGSFLSNRNMLRREKRKKGFRFLSTLFPNPKEYHIPSEALNPSNDIESPYSNSIPENNPKAKKVQKDLINKNKNTSKKRRETKRIQQYKLLANRLSTPPIIGRGGSTSNGGTSGGGGGGY